MFDGQRHCELAVMLRSGYTEDDHLAVAALDLLVNQRRYTVGLTQDAAALDPSAEIVGGASGTWYLMTHPDDSAASSPDGETIRTRPAR